MRTSPSHVAPKLPSASSSTLKLIQATPSQAQECWRMNGSSWRGVLSLEAYVRREMYLGSQSLTKDGGATYWVLIDTEDEADDALILSSCETYRKRALVAKYRADGAAEIGAVVSHGVGSVYCRAEYRGRGYAGRMMEELREILKGWQQPQGRESSFNVLFSDIGKQFYAKKGWIPYPSTHISLPQSMTTSVTNLPEARPIYVGDLHELCDTDEQSLKRSMRDFSGSKAKIRIAFIPDFDVLRWQHAREEFIAQELGKPELDVKGAIVGHEIGHRTWCIWTRKFEDDGAKGTLFVSRMAVESETGVRCTDGKRILCIAACLMAAQREASRLGLARVEVWNPALDTIRAAELLHGRVDVIEREEESIPSLLWYGPEVAPEELEWVGNERYGWC